MNSVASEIVRTLGGRNGVCRCPAHDDKHPSLSIKDDENGGIIVYCHAGCDFRDIMDALRYRGLLPEWKPSRIDPERQARMEAKSRKRDAETRKKDRERLEWCRTVWKETQNANNTPVAVYLASRGIREIPPTTRFHPDLRHVNSGLSLPAMVGVVTQWPSRELIGLHRTFLLPDGLGKADVEPTKMMAGKCKGGAVRLASVGETLAVAEGIETGLSVQQATDIPTWACLSTSGLMTICVPDEVKNIVVFADNDPSGVKAANEAAENLREDGRVVQIALPPDHGTDFNDSIKGAF